MSEILRYLILRFNKLKIITLLYNTKQISSFIYQLSYINNQIHKLFKRQLNNNLNLTFFFITKSIIMSGPHYEKLAEVENKLNARQLLQRIQSRTQNNPLTQVIQKLKRQFSEYQTAYDDQITDHHIHSLDRLLSFDGKLGPILSGLQKQNTLLRKQLNVLQTQLSNTVSICEQILTENNQLKQIIKNKNFDLQKLIQTIALNQSQQRSSLQDKISLMEQENSILIRHLDQIRKEHQTYNQRFMIEKQQTNAWRRKFQQSKKELQHALQLEQQLSRKLSLIEHNLYSESQKVYNLETEIQGLRFENNQMKNQLLVLRNGQTSNSIEGLKQRLQQQYAGIVDEHKALKKQRSELLRQSQSNKLDKEQALDKMLQMQRIIAKLHKDLELTQHLLTDQKQKNSSLQSAISKIQSRLQDFKGENNKLRLEAESTNNYSINKQKALNREIQQLRTQLDKKSMDMQKSLRDIREKTKMLMQAKEGELKSLNDTNIQLRKVLERQQGFGER